MEKRQNWCNWRLTLGRDPWEQSYQNSALFYDIFFCYVTKHPSPSAPNFQTVVKLFSCPCPWISLWIAHSSYSFHIFPSIPQREVTGVQLYRKQICALVYSFSSELCSWQFMLGAPKFCEGRDGAWESILFSFHQPTGTKAPPHACSCLSCDTLEYPSLSWLLYRTHPSAWFNVLFSVLGSGGHLSPTMGIFCGRHFII